MNKYFKKDVEVEVVSEELATGNINGFDF